MHTHQIMEPKNVVVMGDCLAVLPTLPVDSVQLTFTSPPYYNAKAYAQYPSYDAYLDFLVDVFTAVHRITTEGRFLVVNTSPVLEPRERRQDMSHRFGIPFDLHYLLVRHGWDFFDDIVWQKPDGSVANRVAIFNQHRQPLTYRPNLVTEYVMVYRKHTEKLVDVTLRQIPDPIMAVSKVRGQFFRNNVWAINPEMDDVHSAVFPEKLCREIIRYYSVEGDMVLDPFGGSGTVGRVAVGLRRYFTLIERNREYVHRMRTLFHRPEFASASLDGSSYQKNVIFKM